jgi:predicted GIY-YIG superfamily endonuclease
MAQARPQSIIESTLERCNQSAGVYIVYDQNRNVCYVGQSRNLRRRLLQYKNAKRMKKHLKMRTILKMAHQIDLIFCENGEEAEVLENELIQRIRPPLNVVGAYFHRYPFIGYKIGQSQGSGAFVDVTWVLTRTPTQYQGYTFHGVYRSWAITHGAFEALMELLRLVFRLKAKPAVQREYRDQVWSFSGVSREWLEAMGPFFAGKDPAPIADLILLLADVAFARERKKQTQKRLDWIRYFWKVEAKKLGEMLNEVEELREYPLTQERRDQLAIRTRWKNRAEPAPVRRRKPVGADRTQ